MKFFIMHEVICSTGHEVNAFSKNSQEDLNTLGIHKTMGKCAYQSVANKDNYEGTVWMVLPTKEEKIYAY